MLYQVFTSRLCTSSLH